MSGTPDAFPHHFVGWPFSSRKVRHVAVAVSGGGDSMALLDLIQHWALGEKAKLSAVTVDHGLRPEAADEAAMVAGFCAERDIPHEVLKWGGWDGKGNLQAAAREARYRLMADWARERGVEVVCLGHTRDDQAETFLMRLARKAGSDGLRSMPSRFERMGMLWARPLLGVGRAELRVYLKRQNIPWVEDPSNEDEGFDRVKARKALECLAPLGIDAEGLSIVAHNLAMENAVLRLVVLEALAGKVEEVKGSLSMGLRDFRLLEPEIQRRFLVAVIGWISGGDYAPRAGSVSELGFALADRKTHTLAGVIGWVSKDRIWLAREDRAATGTEGNPFDGRWQVEGPLEGLTVRALGAAGLKQLPDWRESGLPRRVLLPLPGVWKGDWLVSAPLIGSADRFKVTLLRPNFDKWLRQH